MATQVIGDHLMAYRDQLYPWCIVRSAPNVPSIIVARFRRPGDAEAHLKILRQTLPSSTLSIIFDKSSVEAVTDTVSQATVDGMVSEPVNLPNQPEELGESRAE